MKLCVVWSCRVSQQTRALFWVFMGVCFCHNCSADQVVLTVWLHCMCSKYTCTCLLLQVELSLLLWPGDVCSLEHRIGCPCMPMHSEQSHVHARYGAAATGASSCVSVHAFALGVEPCICMVWCCCKMQLVCAAVFTGRQAVCCHLIAPLGNHVTSASTNHFQCGTGVHSLPDCHCLLRNCVAMEGQCASNSQIWAAIDHNSHISIAASATRLLCKKPDIKLTCSAQAGAARVGSGLATPSHPGPERCSVLFVLSAVCSLELIECMQHA